MHNRLQSSALAFLVVLVAAGVSWGSTYPQQVDQEFLAPASPSATGYAISNNQAWGQIFTVGMNGYLSQIDLQMGRNVGTTLPLNIEIRKAGAQPDLSPSGLKYSTSIPASSVPTGVAGTFTTSIDLLGGGGSFPVVPGEKYAILGFTGGDWYLWYSATSDSYAGGTALHRFTANSANNFTVRSSDDSGFRTWVSQVPEPGMVGLIGVALLVGVRRRCTLR